LFPRPGLAKVIEVMQDLENYLLSISLDGSEVQMDDAYSESQGRDEEDWFDAHNPLTNARGLVPMDCFESTFGQQHGQGSSPPPGVKIQQEGKIQCLFGIVQFDFEPQRQDELDAKKGEPIVIMQVCHLCSDTLGLIVELQCSIQSQMVRSKVDRKIRRTWLDPSQLCFNSVHANRSASTCFRINSDTYTRLQAKY